MPLKCLRNVVVDGAPYSAGDVVDETDIPAGSLACLLRLRHFETTNTNATPKTREPVAESTATTQPKRGRGRPRKNPLKEN